MPSVVYGLWGITVLVPFLKPGLEWIADTFGDVSILGWQPFEGPVTTGSYLVAGLVLSIMVLPIIAAITREVLATVPREQQEAAYALGATRWEMVRYAMLPWARSGIVGASALGLGRAVGETIAIAVLLGNSPGIFDSLLGPGATLASVIALETGEAGGLQLAALTALAVVLFVLAFLINVVARILVGRGPAGGAGSFARLRPGAARPRRRGRGDRRRGGRPLGPSRPRRLPRRRPRRPGPPRRAGPAGGPRGPPLPRCRGRASCAPASGRASSGPRSCSASCRSSSSSTRWSARARRRSRRASSPSCRRSIPTPPSGGISNALVGTLIMMGLATLFAGPLGLLAALFTAEVGQTAAAPVAGRRTASASSSTSCSAFPSVVVGLTVYLGVVVVQGHFSATAGAIALAVIMFPIVVRSCDEILRLVPGSHKEAALALGAPRWRVTWSVILPTALPGILTGIILAMARAAGETAPLLFTSLGNQFFSTSLSEPIAAIPQLIYYNTITIQTEASIEFAWGAALVLVAMIFVLNVLASVLSTRGRTESR